MPFVDYTLDIRPIAQTILKVDIYLKPMFFWHKFWHKRTERYWVIVDNEKEILHYENYGLNEKNFKDPLLVSFFIPFRPG